MSTVAQLDGLCHCYLDFRVIFHLVHLILKTRICPAQKSTCTFEIISSTFDANLNLILSIFEHLLNIFMFISGKATVCFVLMACTIPHLINDKHIEGISQCTMVKLKNGVKSSQLWQVISSLIFIKNLWNFAQSCLKFSKIWD